MQSCNVALMQIAQAEKRAAFAKYQDAFGFGKPTNVDLLGEASSTLAFWAVPESTTLNSACLINSDVSEDIVFLKTVGSILLKHLPNIRMRLGLGNLPMWIFWERLQEKFMMRQA